MKKIFISSTREDLKEEREKLINFIDSLPDCKAIAMEKFSASKDRSKELCLTELRDSNVLILILGFKYGSIDEEEGISFTEIEYNAAKQLGKLNMPIFVFVKQGSEWTSEEQDANLHEKLIAFKARLDNEKGWAPFNTLDDLIGKVSLTLYTERIRREKIESRLNPLISPKEFFKPFLNNDSYFNHNYSLVGRENFLKSLDEFIVSDKKIAIIQGRGGIGKSKILFEFSQDFLMSNKEWELAFLNEHITLSKEAFPQLPTEKIIIVIDDAHRRNESEIALLLNVLQDYPNYKVIISCRPYGLNYIKTALNRVGIDPKEIDNLPEIEELDSEDLQKLGFEILGKEYQYLIKSLIHVAKDSPLVMVVGGKLLKEKRVNPLMLERQEEFHNVVFNRFENELIGDIGEIDKTIHREVISLISALSPLDTTNEEFYNRASEFLKIKSYELVRIIDLLETSGILLRRGTSVRITPDVLSDHILNNVCVTTQGQSTGYVQKIFHLFWDIMPQNLLLNLSELDWRVNQEEESNSLLSDIWREIEKEFEGAPNSRRFQILGYIERIAIFQPAKTLKLVMFAINNPSKEHEDENLPSYLQTTSKDILHRIPSILEDVAHHLDYLPICCNLLWELGKDDQRETNPNPSHAIRILSNLAKYDLNKDLIFNLTVLDCVEDWLKDPTVHEYKYSPLDILDQFLVKEETTEETTEYQITFYPFSVSYENTKGIRERSLSLLSKCAKIDSTKAKLRVFKSLYDILWPPHGQHNREVNESEVDKWIPEQIKVLKLIENLVVNTDDPIVHIQIYSDLKRVSRALKEDQSIIANNIVEDIPNSFNLQIIRALWDKYDKYEENERLNYYEMLEKTDNIKNQVIYELLMKYNTSQELFNYLERKLDNLEKSGVTYNPDRFLYLMGYEKYKITVEICNIIILNPSCILSPYFSALMSGIRQENKKEAINLSRLALKTNKNTLINSLAQGYAWRMWTSCLDDDDLDLIKILLEYPDENIKSLAIRSLGRFPVDLKPLALELALKTDINDSEKLADAICDIFDENSIPIETLKEEEIKHILDKLILIKDIYHNAYNIGRFIEDCSSKYPYLVIDFLFDRILLSKKEKWVWPNRYEPLPHELQLELKILEDPDYLNILRKVRNKILDPNFSDHWISKLFIEISDGLSPISLQVLYEWVNSNDIKKIEAVVSLLKHSNPDFVFLNVEFVSQLLDKAYSLNKDSYIKLRKKLLNLTFRIRRSIHRQPSPEDTKIKSKSKEISEKLPKNSAAQKFYSLLYENAEKAEKIPLFSEEGIE